MLRAKASVARRVPEVVAGAIVERFGYRVPVVCRSAGEFRKVAEGHSEFKGPVCAVSHATQHLIPRDWALNMSPIGYEIRRYRA